MTINKQAKREQPMDASKMEQMMAERREILHRLQEAQHEKLRVEHAITETLLKEGWINFLKVDWNRLNRAIDSR
jgi:hypothetical protein